MIIMKRRKKETKLDTKTFYSDWRLINATTINDEV